MSDNTPNLARFAFETGANVLKKTGLSRLYDSSLNLFDKNRLGNKKTGPKEDSPNFTVTFGAEADYRVVLKIPENYKLSSQFGVNANITNIIFPYTPTITQDFSANYATVNPAHSNYSFNFYKSSTPGPISVSGKFTVQNDYEARLWLATVHLLRALMKMRYGKDANAGAPPPVCRFSAYGNHQYNNVPVVLQSFKMELPSDVDYYSTGKIENPSNATNKSAEYNMVPTISAISITLLPTYSRRELLAQSQVTDYLNGTSKPMGYL